MATSTDTNGRRSFLVRILTTIHAGIAGILGIILGGVIASPMFGREQETWVPAGSLGTLPENEPTQVTLRVAREDGYREVIDRRTIFLVKGSNGGVTAIDATCTHLGCRVRWDAEAKLIKCPCHGGIYDHMGTVQSGPPPASLARFPTKTDGDQILVRV
jgi:quinol---cytochrome c reductase iron-sulfur subunit, bacillus type